MRISDWSSDVCSSDLRWNRNFPTATKRKLQQSTPPNHYHQPAPWRPPHNGRNHTTTLPTPSTTNNTTSAATYRPHLEVDPQGWRPYRSPLSNTQQADTTSKQPQQSTKQHKRHDTQRTTEHTMSTKKQPTEPTEKPKHIEPQRGPTRNQPNTTDKPNGTTQ